MDAIKEYMEFCEEQLSGAEMNLMEKRLKERRKDKMLEMSGVWVPAWSYADEKVIDFLYDNMEELKDKNKGLTLTEAILKLQREFDDIEFYLSLLGRNMPVIQTVEDMKKQREIINKNYPVLVKKMEKKGIHGGRV